MTTEQVDLEMKYELNVLLEDIWEGITTIYPEYRDAELPYLELLTEEKAEREGMTNLAEYASPDFSDDDLSTIRLRQQFCQPGGDFMGEPYDEEAIPDSIIHEDYGIAPTLAHELTHHLQYLRGEGGLGSWGDFHGFDPNEDEARFMEVALFWDFKCGQQWRYLQSFEEEPEFYDSHTAWFEKLYNRAKAHRMLWERLEKSLAECMEWRESERPPEAEEWAQKRREERARALAEWLKKYGPTESTEQKEK